MKLLEKSGHVLPLIRSSWQVLAQATKLPKKVKDTPKDWLLQMQDFAATFWLCLWCIQPANPLHTLGSLGSPSLRSQRLDVLSLKFCRRSLSYPKRRSNCSRCREHATCQDLNKDTPAKTPLPRWARFSFQHEMYLQTNRYNLTYPGGGPLANPDISPMETCADFPSLQWQGTAICLRFCVHHNTVKQCFEVLYCRWNKSSATWQYITDKW